MCRGQKKGMNSQMLSRGLLAAAVGLLSVGAAVAQSPLSDADAKAVHYAMAIGFQNVIRDCAVSTTPQQRSSLDQRVNLLAAELGSATAAAVKERVLKDPFDCPKGDDIKDFEKGLATVIDLPSAELARQMTSNKPAPAPAAQDGSWGAIAIDAEKYEADPAWGVGGGDTDREAVQNAMKFCREAGGKACKLMVTYNQCGAYAASPVSGGWGKAGTKKTAEAQAMAACNNDRCKIVTSDCN
jgi:hypothetical protein